MRFYITWIDAINIGPNSLPLQRLSIIRVFGSFAFCQHSESKLYLKDTNNYF